MVDYAIANQIRPFQLPDIAGIAGAMQGLELNRMRSQQLQGAEQERNAARALFADPTFDPSAPDAATRILRAAPTTGGQIYNALMAGQREQRQAQAAQTETALKAFDLSRETLRGIADLPEADRPAAWAAWRAQTEASVPGTRGFIPSQYSPAAYTSMISKASEIAKTLTELPTALAGPGGAPVLVDRRTGTFRMGTEVSPAAPAPAPPGAPAPRAEAPSLGDPGRDMAAAMLRRSEGFRPEAYFDRTAFRTGYGSDTITTADGRVVPVTQGTRVTQEDAERDLARRVPEFERRAAAAVGEGRFAALPPNVRAALISVAYNYGTLPGRIRNAVQSGDVNTIAAAVEGLAGDNQGINARRRGEEAAVIRGANAMAPGAALANAMLAPPDATAAGSEMPILPNLGMPRNLAEAQRMQAMQAAIMDLEKKRIEADRARAARREDAPAVAAEAGMTAEATARGQSVVRREDQPARVQEAGETTSAQTRARLEAEETVKRRQDAERLDEAIRELRNITRPGGLLQSSTGSGVGRLRDIAGEALGMSSRGARAAAELAPIADMVLKMVPRFEGPQSDADRKAYEAAAGRLADPTIPNETRLAAARQIIRLMENRRGQFTANPIAPAPTSGAANPSTAPAAPPVPSGLNMTPDNWSRLWNVMTPQERALWQN